MPVSTIKELIADLTTEHDPDQTVLYTIWQAQDVPAGTTEAEWRKFLAALSLRQISEMDEAAAGFLQYYWDHNRSPDGVETILYDDWVERFQPLCDAEGVIEIHGRPPPVNSALVWTNEDDTPDYETRKHTRYASGIHDQSDGYVVCRVAVSDGERYATAWEELA